MELIKTEKVSLADSLQFSKALETPLHHIENPSDKHLQRAKGRCQIVVAGSGKGNRIMDLYQKFPMRILFPRASGDQSQEAVLVNTSGGVAGGDHLHLSVTALSGASMVVTTQAAERIYQALDASAHITTQLSIGNAAKLAWLPQETIVFNRARLCRRIEIEISPGSELLALECLVLGRAAHGEKVSAGAIVDTWQVRKNGRLRWGDTFRLTDDVFSQLARKALLSDSTAFATLLYFGSNLQEPLEFIRAQAVSFDGQCGATVVGGIVVARLAARSSFELKASLRKLLEELGKASTSGPLCVPKMWSC